MLKFSKFSKPIVALIILYFTLPRLAIGIVWATSDYFSPLFTDHIWIILGIVFSPFTFLSYSIGMTLSDYNWSTATVFAIIIALAVDFWYLFPRD